MAQNDEGFRWHIDPSPAHGPTAGDVPPGNIVTKRDILNGPYITTSQSSPGHGMIGVVNVATGDLDWWPIEQQITIWTGEAQIKKSPVKVDSTWRNDHGPESRTVG